MSLKGSSAEQDERTTAVGLFNFAESYRKSADALQEIALKGVTHPESPIEFLYVHAIELFLKAKLRKTKDVSYLYKISHKFKKLIKECSDVVSNCDDDTKNTIEMIEKHKMNENSRYIKTGYYKSYPTLEALSRASRSVEKEVRPHIFCG